MRKRYQVDKTLAKIFDEAEEKFKDRGITRNQIKEIFYLLWANAKSFMAGLEFPTIIFPNWGRFSPKPIKITGWYKAEEDEEVKAKLGKVLERLSLEKLNRKRKKK